MSPESKENLVMKMEIVKVLQMCFDPEIPVNIYDLGLIYDIDIDAEKNVNINMTLTSPACPVAGTLPGEVESNVREIPDVNDVTVEVVWEPPWNPEMMSEAAKLELNMF
jgi:FeS assembly SUF system protein